MEYSQVLEKINKELDLKNDFKVYYLDRERYIKKEVRGEELINREINKKDLEILDSSSRYSEYLEDGSKAYVFNYPNNTHMLLVVRDLDLDFDRDRLRTIYIDITDLYIDITAKLRDEDRETVLKSLKSVSMDIGLKDILNNILVAASKILSKSDLGYIQLYNEAYDSLTVEGAIGFDKSVYEFEPKVGESIAGAVFKDGKARLYNTRAEIEEDSSNDKLSDKNIKSLEVILKDLKFYGLLCVPISYKGKKLGVMTMHKTDEKINFRQEDLDLLESFASKAAISLENAMLIKELEKSLEETQKAHELISKKNKIYKDLTQLSLMNKGLVEITRSLSKMIGVPLLLYNKAKNRVEYNNLVEGENKDIVEFIVDYEKRDIGLSEGVDGKYYYFPIKNGNVFLGYLISEASIVDNNETCLLLEESLMTLTIELMKNYVLEDIIFKRTHEYFTKLISSNDKREVEDYRKRLELPVDRWFISIIAGIENYRDLQRLQMETHNLISLISNEFNDYEFLIYGFHNKVNIVLYMSEREDIDIIRTRLSNVVRLENQLNNTDISIGIGSYYYGVDSIAKSYREAELALSYIMGRDEKTIIEYEEIGINRLFINHMPGDVDKFLEDVLGGLDSEEAEKSNLEETLFHYISSNKSAVETAENLHIHINTFYNRLKRIEKILDVDFDNPEDNLKVQLACHLRKNRKNLIN